MTTSKKITAAVGAATVAAAIYLASVIGPVPAPQVTMTVPWNHNMFEGQAIPGPVVAFSGKWMVHAQQWGAYAVDTTKANWVGGSGTMVSPMTIGPNFQPAPIVCNGDAHQSAQWVVATPGTPKWVVTTEPKAGNVGTCTKTFSPVQVYQLSDATGLRYVGQVFAGNTFGPGSRLDGDTLYADLGNGTFAMVDLNALTVSVVVPSAPPFTPQPDVGGYTFAMAKTGTTTYVLNRQGGPPATVTPPPTPPVTVGPPAVDPAWAQIEALAREGVTAGCGDGTTFCPDRTMTRREVAVWLAKAMQYQLEPCAHRFADVPCKVAP